MQYNGKISFDAADVSKMTAEEFISTHKGILRVQPQYEEEELRLIHASCCYEAGVSPVTAPEKVKKGKNNTPATQPEPTTEG